MKPRKWRWRKILAEVVKISGELKATTDKLAQTGVGVSGLRELLQQLEVRLAKLDGILDRMRNRGCDRRKRE